MTRITQLIVGVSVVGVIAIGSAQLRSRPDLCHRLSKLALA